MSFLAVLDDKVITVFRELIAKMAQIALIL
jgi:hypothetical protein